MKYVVPLIVASLMVAIATAMLETGPLTLPFLVGYLLGIVVPLVVFSGVLTLVALGIYRVLKRTNMPNPAAALWGIWVLVAGVTADRMVDSDMDWGRQDTRLQSQDGNDKSGKSSAALALQARFARDSQQLDA